MKVCTDSCLFGAWVAEKIEKKIISPKTILDIGAGTGLLSLMVAQKSNALIEAVEIDENSCRQAAQNFQESSWDNQLQACHADIQTRKSEIFYDLIIANPPFYEDDLKADKSDLNIAKHNDGLTLLQLLQSIKMNLATGGFFAILLPFKRVGYFKKLAMENAFYVREELNVKQSPGHTLFRSLLFFSANEGSIISEEMAIKDESGKYSEKFKNLLSDFYLQANF